MARLSLSFLALCFFLALMASALPAKRDSTDLDASDAIQTAFDALQAMDNVKENIKTQTEKKKDDASAAKAAQTEDRTATAEPVPMPESESVPSPSPSSTAAEKPAPAASSSAAAPAGSAHASDNFLSKVPIFGPLLGGGQGLGSIL
ncbi:uncharacterized protein ACLA_045680 [Aspergillus clavatus NRRL 1]|uniref:Uncharacterized protein n=1 Tax=Aspergillus clavatus (strain ATCC 1007 / CBS 513.65 / DSM 816 / NCTC 3887 / NRRL 1 / QM 1276 / 107) TaxID=344612 RepID=A1CGU8_ASPCL|nr:uncharacterized protein ACLA_045680 [Aspergillus clavatus NRRL 1]EAW10103.1 conserved hypothetical protein [Aspergillus clavatus NRRL 1]